MLGPASSRPRALYDGESALSLALLITASQARHAPRLRLRLTPTGSFRSAGPFSLQPSSTIPVTDLAHLVLFTQGLGVRFAVGIEEFFSALLPGRFELGRRDVPVRPAFLGNGSQILAQIFHRGPAEEPVAIVDLVYGKARFQDNDIWDHRIVERTAYSAISRSFWTLRPGSERKGQWARLRCDIHSSL